MPTKGRRGTGVPVPRAARPVRPMRKDGWRRHSDKAWLATQELQKMLPVFTSFARSISGNKTVRVAVGQGSMTDGQTIWVVPPIELGTVRMHDKMLCNKRGEDGILLCKACDTREMVLFPLYHEIGHVSFNSLAQIDNFYRRSYLEVIEEWHPDGVCAHGLLIKDQASKAQNGARLCVIFDPYLMQIFNCMEDARVNASMFRVRPGLSKMFDTQIARLFERGVPIPHSDEVVRWETADLNAQVCIGLFLISSGYTVGEGYLSADAIKVLDDDKLRAICGDVQMARTVQQTFEYTIRAWRRLQELGVCFKEKCKPAPEEKDGEGTDGEGSPPIPGADDSGSGEPGGSDGSGGAGSSSSDSSSGSPDGNDSSGSKDSGPDGTGSMGSPSASDSSVESDGSSSGGDSEGDTSESGSSDADLPGSGDGGHSVDTDGSPDGDTASGSDDGTEPDEGEDSESEDSSHSKGSTGGDPEEPGPDGAGDDSLEGTSLDEGGGDEDASDEGDGSSPDKADGTDAEEDGEDPDSDERGDGRGGDSDGDGDADDGWSDDGDDPEEESEDGLADDYEYGDVDPVEYRKALSAEGDPELLARMINILNSHDPNSTMEDFSMDHSPMEADGFHGTLNDSDVEKALLIAAIQAEWFDRSSKNIVGTEVFKAPFAREVIAGGWGYYGSNIDDYRVNPAIINQATLKARVVFDENARGKESRNLKSGKIDSRVLGRRAPLADERLFKKKIRPGKRDYFVVIGADCSGSTAQRDRISRIKRAVYAQAEMLHRLGVKFAIYGHTGNYATRIVKANPHISDTVAGGDGMALWMLEVKGPDAPWDNKAKAALASLQPIAANLDGHTMEFYRKVTDRVRATDKIIMYYTDGAMPLENYDEERAILEEEIDLIRRRKTTLLGVGIDTDSPKQYGLSTVIVRSDDDLPLVVEHLKAQLVR